MVGAEDCLLPDCPAWLVPDDAIKYLRRLSVSVCVCVSIDVTAVFRTKRRKVDKGMDGVYGVRVVMLHCEWFEAKTTEGWCSVIKNQTSASFWSMPARKTIYILGAHFALVDPLLVIVIVFTELFVC